MMILTNPEYPLIPSSSYGNRGSLASLIFQNGIDFEQKIIKPKIHINKKSRQSTIIDLDLQETARALKDELAEIERLSKYLPSVLRHNRYVQINHLLDEDNIQILSKYNVMKAISKFVSTFHKNRSYHFTISHDQQSQKISISYRSAEHEPIKTKGMFSVFFKEKWINRSLHIKKDLYDKWAAFQISQYPNSYLNTNQATIQ